MDDFDNLILDDLICPYCKGGLKKTGNEVNCSNENCEIHFRTMGNLILLHKNVLSIISKQLISYNRYRNQLLERVRNQRLNNHRNPQTIDLLSRATLENLKFLDEIFSEAQDFVSSLNLLNENPNQIESPYLSHFEYLRRDWSYKKDSEKEINTITSIIISLVNNNSKNKSTGLFLGSGPGRIARELSRHFKRSISVDNSITMSYVAANINSIRKDLYEINLRNAISINNLVCPFSFGCEEKLKTNNLSFILSDVRSMPIESNSMSNVFSIYFTDVIPLSEFIYEIKRVLKNGGIFYHFGPLHYHFEDYSQMLTCEEIKHLFQANEFTILEEGFAESTLNSSENNMYDRVFLNWYFAAEYKFKKSSYNIGDESIIDIDKGFEYSINGSVIPPHDEDLKCIVNLPNGEKYSCPYLVIELINRFDGRKKLRQILDNIREDYNQEFDSLDEINEHIEILIKGQAIKIVT